jgi:hypothetical protein
MKIAALLGYAIALVELLCPVNSSAGSFSFALPGEIKISATEAPFDPSKHHLSGCGEAYKTCVIDDRVAVGAIHMPKTELSDLVLAVGGKTYHLDTRAMYDPLLQPTEGRNFGVFCYDSSSCTVRALLGDAGGTHFAEWIIANGVQRRSVLSDSSDLITFAKAHLMPPHFE